MVRPTLVLILAAVAALGIAPAAGPPDAFTVLDSPPDGPRITPYLAYQTEMAWRQDDRRRAGSPAIRTERRPAAAAGANCARSCCRMLGGLPSTRTPLNAQITGRIQMAGFHIEKVDLREPARDLRDGAGVRARRRARAASGGARARAATRPTARRTTRRSASGSRARGYVVICWDPVGQGERSQFWDASREAKPLQPDLRRARRPRQSRLPRGSQPRALGSVGRHARARLPAHDGRRSIPRASASRAPAAAASRPPSSRRSTRGSDVAAPVLLHHRAPDARGEPHLQGSRQRPRAGSLRHDRGRRRSRGPAAADVSAAGVRGGRGTGLLPDRRHAPDVPRGRRRLPALRPSRPHRDDRGLPRARVLRGEPGRRLRVPRSIQRHSRAAAICAATTELDDRGPALHPHWPGAARPPGRQVVDWTRSATTTARTSAGLARRLARLYYGSGLSGHRALAGRRRTTGSDAVRAAIRMGSGRHLHASTASRSTSTCCTTAAACRCRCSTCTGEGAGRRRVCCGSVTAARRTRTTGTPCRSSSPMATTSSRSIAGGSARRGCATRRCRSTTRRWPRRTSIARTRARSRACWPTTSTTRC